MHAQYTLFQQGYNLMDEINPYMKKLAAEVSSTMFVSGPKFLPKPNKCRILVCSVCLLQLDQLVIDSAMEKRVMEHQHAVIQQRVSNTFNLPH